MSSTADAPGDHPSPPLGGWLVAVFGLTLFAAALFNFQREVTGLGELLFPLLALAVAGGLALALAAGGYWLTRQPLSAAAQFQAAVWSGIGGSVVGGAMVLTMGVRAAEGRVVSEPLFTLVTTTSIGGLAGLFVGVLYARADQRREVAERTTERFEFLNSVLRHDIRNDVTLIRAQADSIDVDGPQTTHVEGIRRRSEAIASLIDDADLVARTYTGDADREPVHLQTAVAETAETARSSFPDATVTTAVEGDTYVLANDALRRVLANLVGNAVEHNHTPVPTVRLVEAPTDDPDRVCLHVRDDGPGIPADEREGLFEQDDDEGPHGFGLVAVKRLTESLGGDVRVVETGPDGTTICVDLERAEGGA